MKKYLEETVISKPDFCVPATLEMVLKHHNIMHLTQDDIAAQLQIVPAEDDVAHEMWGTQIGKNTINDFFISNGLALREKYIPISHFMDEFFLADEIAYLLHNEVSIICGYNYSWLYGSHGDTFRHVSIIVGISMDNREVELLDPGPKNAGYNTVRIDTLFDAIKAGHDGLWCIS